MCYDQKSNSSLAFTVKFEVLAHDLLEENT